MPFPVFHLWIAREYAKNRPALRKDPDYYLGNIAPDGVIMRCKETEELKNITHLFTTKEQWEQDTIESYRQLVNPTPFQVGYYMHVLTDILYRSKSRAFNTAHNIPRELWEKLHRHQTPTGMRRLFSDVKEYYELVDLAAQSRFNDFPYCITYEDIQDELKFSRDIFELFPIKVAEDEMGWPVPDSLLFSMEIVNNLEVIL